MKMKIWHIALFVLALVVFALAFAPAAVFVPRPGGGFSYERAEGSIWRATIQNARIGPYDGGNIAWRLSLGELVNLRLNGLADLNGGSVRGQVRIISNLSGDRRIVAERLEVFGVPFGESLLAGDTTISGLDVAFVDGRCYFARGELRSDVLSRNDTTLGLRGPELSGGGACDGETAKYAFTGERSGAQIRVLVELHSNGGGSWRTDAFNASGERETLPVLSELKGDLRWFPF